MPQLFARFFFAIQVARGPEGQLARTPGGLNARWPEGQVAGGTKKWGIPEKIFQNVAQLH